MTEVTDTAILREDEPRALLPPLPPPVVPPRASSMAPVAGGDEHGGRDPAGRHGAATRDGAGRWGPAYAAIDLGTNNCRLMIGTPAGGGFRVIDSFSRVVRLGEGLHDSGQLSQAAMDRALSALHACASRLSRRPVRGLRAVATEACRRAANGAAFLARARAETGLPIETVSTREEAELAVESCAPLLAGIERRALLFDIGGGSTELAWVRTGEAGGRRRDAPELIGYVSIPVGVVTLAEQFGAEGFTEAGFTAMVEVVTELLRPFESVHCIGREIAAGGVHLLGTSGTVTTLAGVALGLERYRRPLIDGAMLDREAAAAALAALRAMGREGLMRHPCVGPERAEFVLPGCAIYAAIAALWPAGRVTVADRGLREGMLMRMIRADRGGRPGTLSAAAKQRGAGAARRS